MSKAFSDALNNVLHAIDPGNRPAAEGCYPRQCQGADLRVSAGELPEAWFKRLVDGPLQGDINTCTIEANLALFLQFGSEKERRFRYLRCQALAVIGGTLKNAYSATPGMSMRYLRLEYEADPLVLGELFSHPVVHIHSQPQGSPRFALEVVQMSNVVLLDFLDFLYRNFCQTSWNRWATAVWRRSASSPETATHFETIRSYFLEEDNPGKRARLPKMLDLCREWLPRMKQAFRKEKDNMPMNLTVDTDHRDLFTYHA